MSFTQTTARVPFMDLAAQQAEVAQEVLPVWRALFESAAFVGGPEVTAFEQEYAAYIGVEHVVGVSNGTDALELAYRAVGVGPGDEVIMPANTFIATAEAASRIGATPVFVDVDEDYLLIDPHAVEAAVNDRTRAIVPVHLYGQTAPVEFLAPIAAKHGLTIVEDAAQAQGASSTNARAGAFGPIAATSFYPGKNLGAAGDGGAVLTDDPDMAAFVRNVAAHGSAVKSASMLAWMPSKRPSCGPNSAGLTLGTPLAELPRPGTLCSSPTLPAYASRGSVPETQMSGICTLCRSLNATVSWPSSARTALAWAFITRMRCI